MSPFSQQGRSVFIINGVFIISLRSCSAWDQDTNISLGTCKSILHSKWVGETNWACLGGPHLPQHQKWTETTHVHLGAIPVNSIYWLLWPLPASWKAPLPCSWLDKEGMEFQVDYGGYRVFDWRWENTSSLGKIYGPSKNTKKIQHKDSEEFIRLEWKESLSTLSGIEKTRKVCWNQITLSISVRQCWNH